MANHNLDANAAQNSPGPYGSPQETIGGIQVPDFGTQIGTGAFVNGQIYTALSRCRTLNGITLKRKLKSEDIIADKRIINFHQTEQIIDSIN